MCFNSSGQITNKLPIHTSLESNEYIVKVYYAFLANFYYCLQTIWCPGSETELAIITDTFVKIYDLSVDTISPLYYFLVCSDKIRDATIIVSDKVSWSCMAVML